MGAETVRIHQSESETDQARQIYQLQTDRLRRMGEAESPLQTLGNIGMLYLFGTTIGHNALMPQTEAVALEGLTLTLDTGDTLNQAA